MQRSHPSLSRYQQKRDFTQTTEPSGRLVVAPSNRLRFVIQKHAASHLHYDLRLELSGVFKSWAVTKGPSPDPGDKRLAVEVEDHPLDYGDFEGTIPKGQYGGGTVQLWDRGYWEPAGNSPEAALEKGELKFTLEGKRLRGSWVLVRLKSDRSGSKRTNWLLIKHRDQSAKPGEAQALLDLDRSVASGRSMRQIEARKGKSPAPFMLVDQAVQADAVWHSNRVDKSQSVLQAPAATVKAARRSKAAALKSLPTFIEPQLCKLVERPPAASGWAHEVKFDGYRAQLCAFGNRGKLIGPVKSVTRAHAGCAALDAKTLSDCILDGEVCALDHDHMPSFAAFFQFSAEEARIIEERRRPELKLGLALQIGFLRMNGRLLDAVRMVPPLLWRHLGARFDVTAPDLASLRARYRRAPTLIEHQQIACDALGFHWLTGHHRRALVRVLRQELDRTDDRERLLGFARGWLYEHRLIIVHERLLRSMIAAARREHEAQLARRIDHAVEPGLMIQWRGALIEPHGSGSSLQTWLWAPPAKHSSRQIEEMVARIECLCGLRVHERMGDFPDDLLRRHARRLASRPPSAGALIQEPARSIETACFLRYCLLTTTDRLLMMVRRQVADLWRRAAIGATATQGDWALLYQELLAALGAIVAEPAAGDEGILGQLHSLLAAHRARRPASRAQLVRERLIEGVRPVRSLLNALVRLPWQATDNHPVLQALHWLFPPLGAPDSDPAVFLGPLMDRAEAGMAAVAAAAQAGTLRIDDELHLTPLAAEEEDPEVAKLRIALDRRIGEAHAGGGRCPEPAR
jgi:DNA ligase D-like protein (predicted 3'-phosphoesterase)